MADAARTFYRIIKTNPPTVADFLSNQAKGLPRRDNEAEEIWAGLSHFDTADQARLTARKFPQMGAFLATIRLRDNGPFRMQQTLCNRPYATDL